MQQNSATPPLLKNPEQLALLLENLTLEIQHLEAVQEHLTRKQQALVSGQPQALAPIDQQLLTLSKKALGLNKQRDQLLTQMGCPGTPLKKLINHMPGEYVPRFRAVRDQLYRAASDVERLNRENRDLLALSLHWVKDTVEIIMGAMNPEAASYTAQGAKKAKPNGPMPNSVAPQSTITHSA